MIIALFTVLLVLILVETLNDDDDNFPDGWA